MIAVPTAESFEDFLGGKAIDVITVRDTADSLAELDEADFNISDEGHPDEVVLTISNDTDSNQSNASNKSHNQTGNGVNNSMQPPARQFSRTTSAGNNPPQQPPQTPMQQAPRPNTNQFAGAGAGAGAQNRGPQGGPRPPQQFNQNRPGPQPNNGNQNQNRPTPQANNANPNNNSNQNQSRPAPPPPNNAKPINNPNHSLNHNPQAHMTPPQTGKNTGEVGWFSARVMSDLPADAIAPKPGQAFNWKLQSPSIPRTPGIDHSASKPLSRKGQHVVLAKTGEEGEGEGEGTDGAGGQQQQPPVGNGIAADINTSAPRLAAGGPRPTNIVNPQLSQTRRIGAPGSSSPLGNRGQFRPLTVKRPAGADGPPVGGGPVAGRVPLVDVSNHGVVGAGAVNAGGGVGAEKRDMKRQRTS
jgi:DNA repair and recombination protein RAD52